MFTGLAVDPSERQLQERSQIIEKINSCKSFGNEWIKRQVLQNDRIDILAKEVLGYDVKPLHLKMLKFQFEHTDSLQLIFRGAGKSTLCTVTKIIDCLLKDPDLRILIASKTSGNAQNFLREVKGHFESNEKLAEIFGEYYHPKLSTRWNETEIEVLPRKIMRKEASVTIIGADATIIGRHFDMIFSDDLIDEENAKTEYMRKKMLVWYYKVLTPTLEPPDPEVPFRGQHHRLGTRYHFQDLYGHLIENELANDHQIIKALNEKGQSPWPEKYPPQWFLQKRKVMGLIIFNSQYQNDTEAMKGEIFQYDDCQIINYEDVPKSLRIFIGVDLAISQKETADNFALVVLGKDNLHNRYILDFFEGKLRFGKQTKKIIEYYNKWKAELIGVEKVAYQESQIHNLEEKREKRGEDKLPLKGVPVNKDKTIRAWKLSRVFENKQFFFVNSGKIHHMIEKIVLFPNTKKDLFDALDIADKVGQKKKIKERRQFGLISIRR